MRNTTRLQQINGGRQVKQSDKSSVFEFILQDANGRQINLDGQQAHVVLYNREAKLYWEDTVTVVGANVKFTLPGNLVDDDYILEVSSGGYVFPSDENLIIRVNQGYAEYVGFVKAYAIKKTTRDIIKEETQSVAKTIASELDYSQLKGEKGEPFRYSDFTKEQLIALKGEKGEPFRFSDFTDEQLNQIKGEQGDPFTYDDFTDEQLADLKGEKGDAFTYDDFTPDQLEKLKGDAFTYDDFTEEQLAKLKGAKGDPFTYDDLTQEQILELKGDKGDAFKYDDFTDEQLRELKGEQGDSITVLKTSTDDAGNITITFSDNTQILIPKGEKGDKGEPLKYEDLTPEQKEELKGKDGTMSFEDLTPEQKETLKGAKGDPFTYDDFTDEQLVELKGDPFTYDDFTQEQLLELKGDKGDTFTYDDFTEEQLAKLKGAKGDPFTYEDFTQEQLERLKGKDGKSITIKSQSLDNAGDRVVVFSDDTTVTIPKGQDGEDGSDATVTAGTGLRKSGSTLSVNTAYVATKTDLKSYAKAADIPKIKEVYQEDYNNLSYKDRNTFYLIIEG